MGKLMDHQLVVKKGPSTAVPMAYTLAVMRVSVAVVQRGTWMDIEWAV